MYSNIWSRDQNHLSWQFQIVVTVYLCMVTISQYWNDMVEGSAWSL